MKLLTETQRAELLKNGANRDADHTPVVKLFNPCGAATWLFTELDEDGDTLFGLCDLGFGFPELGYASLSEIAATRLPFGLTVERDLHFRARAGISVYAEAARSARRIVEAGPEFDAARARHQVANHEMARHDMARERAPRTSVAGHSGR